jgi:hypothetical protein
MKCKRTIYRKIEKISNQGSRVLNNKILKLVFTLSGNLDNQTRDADVRKISMRFLTFPLHRFKAQLMCAKSWGLVFRRNKSRTSRLVILTLLFMELTEE